MADESNRWQLEINNKVAAAVSNFGEIGLKMDKGPSKETRVKKY